MNWEAISAIGEMLGATGVILTLVYLALQIRQNTKSMDESRKVALAATYQARAEMRKQGHDMVADSEHLAPIMQKLESVGWPDAVDGIQTLSADESLRFKEWLQGQVVLGDNVFYQYRLGLLDKEIYDTLELRIGRIGPSFHALELVAPSSFQAEIDRITAQRDSSATS